MNSVINRIEIFNCLLKTNVFEKKIKQAENNAFALSKLVLENTYRNDKLFTSFNKIEKIC